jgi:hypothetical protein
MAGEATLSGSGKSCADSYSEAVRKRIERWMKPLTLNEEQIPQVVGNNENQGVR